MRLGRFEENEIVVVKDGTFIPEDDHHKYQTKFRFINYNSYGDTVYCENFDTGEGIDINEHWLETAYKKEVPFKRNFEL